MTKERVPRRLAAILAADVVQYPSFKGYSENGDLLIR
jgi:hypothetical protein